MTESCRSEWSNLPSDLLQEIFALLPLPDQGRLRCVCKNWLSHPWWRQTLDRFPWMLTFSRISPSFDRLQYNLYDPVHTRPCSSMKIRVKEYWHTRTWEHGWVCVLTDHPGRSSFALFSPFTEKTVALPDLHHDFLRQGYFRRRIAFSCEPTSKDCVFFVLSRVDYERVMLATYKHGDEQWVTEIFDSPFLIYGIENLVYFEGNLYFAHGYPCSSSDLSAYYAANRKWKKNLYINSRTGDFSEQHLIESDGELLLVCFGSGRYVCAVFTLNRSMDEFVPKKCLANRALFIGQCNSISLPAIGVTKHLENKIFYYDREKHCKFYSLIDGKSYNSNGIGFGYSGIERLCNKYGLVVLPPKHDKIY